MICCNIIFRVGAVTATKAQPCDMWRQKTGAMGYGPGVCPCQGVTMHFPIPFLIGALIASPLMAQPSANPDGPLAADSNGDAQVSRDEMTVWIDQRFVGMDYDGDGRVPVQAMRQILGHERQEGGRLVQQDGGRAASGPGPEGGGMGMGGGNRGGSGGPPPGGRPPADQPARADGRSPASPGTALPWPEDGNDDGMIDRAEFAAPALAMFADEDRNGDGVLSGDELPPRREGPPRG
jgi:hypothetical protein